MKQSTNPSKTSRQNHQNSTTFTVTTPNLHGLTRFTALNRDGTVYLDMRALALNSSVWVRYSTSGIEELRAQLTITVRKGRKLSKTVHLRRENKSFILYCSKLRLSWLETQFPSMFSSIHGFQIGPILWKVPGSLNNVKSPFIFAIEELRPLALSGFSKGSRSVKLRTPAPAGKGRPSRLSRFGRLEKSAFFLRLGCEVQSHECGNLSDCAEIPPIKKASRALEKKANPRFDQRVKVQCDDGKSLYGLYSEPRKNDGRLPIVILIHGSGPEDHCSGSGFEGRDLRFSSIRFFEHLREQLNAHGIAVVSYDKRGVGKSQGEWIETSRTRLTEDLLSVYKKIKEEFQSREIILCGFSEGANLAISAAKKIPNLSGLILGCSPAQSVDEVVLDKIEKRRKLVPELDDYFLFEGKKFQQVFDWLRKNAKEIKKESPQTELLGYPPLWWLEHLEFSPREIIPSVKCPALILHGKDDLEVLHKEAILLKRCRDKSDYPTKMVSFDRLNHFFAPSFLSLPGFEYEIPYPPDPALSKAICRWIQALTKKATSRKRERA